MPTKDELIAYASDVGVDVSSSALKADIEAALIAAGYDPNDAAPEADTTMSETESTPAPEGEDPFEVGYSGVVPDEIENDAYTLEGQGAETAKREREQLRDLRTKRYYGGDEDA